MSIKNHYGISLCMVSMLLLGGCFGVRSDSSITMSNLTGKTNIMPIAVIGSGPAGLMAALYGARGGKKTYIIEGNKPGGLLMETTEVENWPGSTMILGPQIIDQLLGQVRHHGVTFVADAVAHIDTSQWPYKLMTENGQELYALTVIIATGASPRLLGIPGEQAYWGIGVTSCAVCDAAFFKGQDVVVIGGGDSAVEEAIQLAAYARNITILVRKGAMRAAASMQDRLKAYDKIAIKYNVDVLEIVGDSNKVTGIKLYNNVTKTTEHMNIDGVFLAIGHVPNTKFIRGTIPTDANGYIHVQGRTQATQIPGIFAAGDVEDHRYRQAGSAAGYGIAAGLDAVRFLDEHGYTPAVVQQIQEQLYQDLQPTQHEETSVQTLTSLDQLNALIATKGVAFMDFWADDCPTCKHMLPIFHAVAQEYTGKASFLTVNIDEAQEVIEKLFVQKVPCVLVFQDGNLVARYTDPMNTQEMTAFVEQFVSPSPTLA